MGKERLTDPLRHRDVAATPEEKVRQWFVSQLLTVCRVPAPLMCSEVSFRYGEKNYRADVVVYDRSGAPLAIVECKRPEVVIDDGVARQALRYNAVLSVKLIILTNGNITYVFKRAGNRFEPVSELPDYESMLCL